MGKDGGKNGNVAINASQKQAMTLISEKEHYLIPLQDKFLNIIKQE